MKVEGSSVDLVSSSIYSNAPYGRNICSMVVGVHMCIGNFFNSNMCSLSNYYAYYVC
jgi:hypothetical protein